MNDDLGNVMEEFRKEIADAQGYTHRDKGIRNPKGFSGFKVQRKTLLYGCIGILVVIILIVLFLKSGDKSPIDDPASIQAKFDELESKLKHIEELAAKVPYLEKEEKTLQQSIHETVRSGKDLAERVDSLSKKVQKLEKGIASVPNDKAKDSVTIHEKPVSAAKKRFHEVRAGENLYRIAKTYGITLDELCRLNNMTPNQTIQPGQKLLLAPSSDQ